MSTSTVDPRTSAALYERWLTDVWGGDEVATAELVTDDFVIHHGRIRPGSEDELAGPEGIAQLVAMSRQPFSEITFEVEVGPVVSGDLVCARWAGRGVYAGGLPGATAEPGTVVEFSGNDILRVVDGRFAEYWVCSDGPWLMEQLGVDG